MEEAIADELLKDQQLIVFTKNKKKGKIQKKHTRLKGDLKQGKYLCCRMKIVLRE
jgi:carboxyl-terminal processing protease